MECWNGMLEWNVGMQCWNAMLERNVDTECWNGMLVWNECNGMELIETWKGMEQNIRT